MLSGPSVDEVCLLKMTQDVDICYFKERDSSHIRLRRGRGNEEYEILKIFPFTSERKAMSIVVRNTMTDRVFAYVKGADSAMLPKCTL